MTETPIADYALLSDCHSASLLSREGSIDWLCLPRFDSPSVFGRLLDEAAGHWSITASDAIETSRRYVDRTMVLERSIRTETGLATITEAMALALDESDHDLGRGAPGVLLRQVRCDEGEVAFEMEFAPRPEYGLIYPLLAPVPGGVAGHGGAQQFVLSTSFEIQIERAVARLRFSLSADESAGFALHHGPSWEDVPPVWSQADITDRLKGTVQAWQAWSSAHQRYDGPWSDLVYHSGRVLQALMYQPTGAIVAAPTTSLPEDVGGERNWDYRYAWVRDASFTLDALWVAACPDESSKFFSWMAGAVASQIDFGADLQIMFGIGGEHDLSERVLPHLSGWRGSRPVRTGNGAWSQRQLDVYGELLGAAERLKDQLGDLPGDTERFLVQVADAAASRWGEQDQGIWEVRGEPRDFVYSKLMCWVALDRAISLAPALGAGDRVEDWTATREEIRRAILEKGWSEEVEAFTQSFDSQELDASNLMIPIVGFLPPDDPRVLSTIEATERDLTDERGLVFRYKAEDGLTGSEGTFLLCTFWLAQAQAMAGRVEDARATFERSIAFANDVGLLAEEVDEATGELLGNFPQAFSHIGLVNAAWAIAEAERRGER
ncbi:MAG: glycoside hydrolase family 15 protein [Actinobacteria bacterium]|nr:glycoside hydrolase family 15 protein [Actinomycetota bacterium]